MNSTPVLIAARADGLVLALSLARRGVPFRIIDAASGPGQHSRAMAVQARTLEFYRQFGFADEMIKCGVIAAAPTCVRPARTENRTRSSASSSATSAPGSPVPLRLHLSARRPRTFPQRKTRGDL